MYTFFHPTADSMQAITDKMTNIASALGYRMSGLAGSMSNRVPGLPGIVPDTLPGGNPAGVASSPERAREPGQQQGEQTAW